MIVENSSLMGTHITMYIVAIDMFHILNMQGKINRYFNNIRALIVSN